MSTGSPRHAIVALAFALALVGGQRAWGERVVHDRVLALLTDDGEAHRRELDALGSQWRPELPALLLDAVRFVDLPDTAVGIFRLLEEKTGQGHGTDWSNWSQWWWNQPIRLPPHYAEFKARLYRQIDPRFESYFAGRPGSRIRLDEVVWGGVPQDGIPPLRQPKMISAAEASYLQDGNIVFGIEVNGDARAYPKRILAWHEMFVDRVGGIDVAGVYCTLCGTVILYETRVGGRLHRMGTSGFLYRSNKLMYDQDTASLWNTLEGRPVVGPLVGKGIALRPRSVVTTTWADWKRRHPGTRVLSPETGHERDYGEGVAYRKYFATDNLMFPVPRTDARLRNKDEVLVPRFGGERDKPLAIDSAYLRSNPVHHGARGGQPYVILTDRSGAHRIYALASARQSIASWDGESAATDSQGVRWRLTEAALEAPGKPALKRLPSHNAFWFGWHAAFPNTELVR